MLGGRAGKGNAFLVKKKVKHLESQTFRCAAYERLAPSVPSIRRAHPSVRSS